MNRHMRRAQTKKARGLPPALADNLTKALTTLQSLEEFTVLANQLKPCLEGLMAANARLQATLEAQRKTFLRLLASATGRQLDEIILLEAVAIQEELHANETAKSTEQDSKTDSSSQSSGGVETTLTQSNPTG